MERQKVSKLFGRIAYLVELVISGVLLLAIVLLLVELVVDSHIFTLGDNHLAFNELLERIFNLVIGVEFTKMLYLHTPEIVVEVLLFATARQIVLSHDEMFSNVLGVLAIAGLFAVKKYLLASAGTFTTTKTKGRNEQKKSDLAS